MLILCLRCGWSKVPLEDGEEGRVGKEGEGRVGREGEGVEGRREGLRGEGEEMEGRFGLREEVVVEGMKESVNTNPEAVNTTL